VSRVASHALQVLAPAIPECIVRIGVKRPLKGPPAVFQEPDEQFLL